MSENMSQNMSQKMEKKDSPQIPPVNMGNLLSDFFVFQKIKAWGTLFYVKVIAGLGAIALILGLILDVCDISQMFFGWDLCPEDSENSKPIQSIGSSSENGSKPIQIVAKKGTETKDGESKDEPEATLITTMTPLNTEIKKGSKYEDDLESLTKLARNLFVQNPANLQVEIQPAPPLSIGKSMYLRVSNKSDNDGYLLALNINSEGILLPLIPHSPQQIQDYLKLNAGQTRIIPDPDDSFDPPRFFIKEPIGQEILVAILVDELPLGLSGILFPETAMEPAKTLQSLHDKLTKPVQDAVSGTSFLQWFSLVKEYQTISSIKKE